MKIHFFGSLSGNEIKTGNRVHYERIVDVIEELGYEIVTRHYVTKKVDEVLRENPAQHEEYFRKMVDWIKKADVIVAEVTKPEIGTGYEVSMAINYFNKPVIALYTSGRNSPIFIGQKSDKLQHLEYRIDNIKDVLKIALDDAKDQMDVRFNFFISPKIGAYLDWISKNRKLPRAVYLRKLIEEDMAKGDYEAKEVKNKKMGGKNAKNAN